MHINKIYIQKYLYNNFNNFNINTFMYTNKKKHLMIFLSENHLEKGTKM